MGQHIKTNSQIIARCTYNDGTAEYENFLSYYKDGKILNYEER